MTDQPTPAELNSQLGDIGFRVAVAMTGGGLQGFAPLLNAGGASKWLEAFWFPYGMGAITDFLGKEPEQWVSTQTAHDFAYTAAGSVSADRPDELIVGIGVTSKLTYPGEREGRDHLIIGAIHCVAPVFDGLNSKTFTIVPKGETREAQEAEAGQLVQQMLNFLIEKYKAN